MKHLTVLTGAVNGSHAPAIIVRDDIAAHPPFPVRIGEEIMLVTGAIGRHWQVARGSHWTPAHQHPAGESILLLGADELPQPPEPPLAVAPAPLAPSWQSLIRDLRTEIPRQTHGLILGIEAEAAEPPEPTRALSAMAIDVPMADRQEFGACL